MNFASLATWKNFRYISGEKLFEDPDFKIAHLHIPEEIIILGNEVELLRTIEEVFPGQASYDPWDEIDAQLDAELSTKPVKIISKPVTSEKENSADDFNIEDYVTGYENYNEGDHPNIVALPEAKMIVGIYPEEYNDQFANKEPLRFHGPGYCRNSWPGQKVFRFTGDSRCVNVAVCTKNNVPPMQKKKFAKIISKARGEHSFEDRFIKRDPRKRFRKEAKKFTDRLWKCYEIETEWNALEQEHYQMMAEADELLDELFSAELEREDEFDYILFEEAA